ncbi:plant UBX domain-containing protein 1-like [Apium graveolens]|uniref:plant UBX domain-containing protein 1-like n=1 Tax=Apium graveolens TaxID=4045 RepID=UPI003D7B46EF
MDAKSAKAKLHAAKHKLGRDFRVFQTSIVSQTQIDASKNDDEEDDMYDFTPADYYRVLGPKKQDNVLKTRKIREAEEAARRSRITKAIIRVRFPDNHTLEVTFYPSETIQLLFDFLKQVLARPEFPFNLYTTPPKKLIKDMAQDFYSAGFAPGAIVYFSQDLPKDDNGEHESGFFLQEEIISLKGLELIAEQVEPVQPAPESSEPAVQIPSAAAKEQKAADKKAIKPKWLRM